MPPLSRPQSPASMVLQPFLEERGASLVLVADVADHRPLHAASDEGDVHGEIAADGDDRGRVVGRELHDGARLEPVGVVVGDEPDIRAVPAEVDGRLLDPAQPGRVDETGGPGWQRARVPIAHPLTDDVVLTPLVEELRGPHAGKLAEARDVAGIEKGGLDRAAWRGEALPDLEVHASVSRRRHAGRRARGWPPRSARPSPARGRAA